MALRHFLAVLMLILNRNFSLLHDSWKSRLISKTPLSLNKKQSQRSSWNCSVLTCMLRVNPALPGFVQRPEYNHCSTNAQFPQCHYSIWAGQHSRGFCLSHRIFSLTLVLVFKLLCDRVTWTLWAMTGIPWNDITLV